MGKMEQVFSELNEKEKPKVADKARFLIKLDVLNEADQDGYNRKYVVNVHDVLGETGLDPAVRDALEKLDKTLHPQKKTDLEKENDRLKEELANAKAKEYCLEHGHKFKLTGSGVGDTQYYTCSRCGEEDWE
jgi:hypothetical protein